MNYCMMNVPAGEYSAELTYFPKAWREITEDGKTFKDIDISVPGVLLCTQL